MTQQEVYQGWKPTVLGEVIGDGQCVSLVVNNPKAYAEALFPGINWQSIFPPVGAAKQLMSDANQQYFEAIPNDHNDPNQVPQQGDVMVFDATPQAGYTNSFNNPYGHTGICESADANGYVLLQQNSPFSGVPVNATHYPWNYRPCLGWLRPVSQVAPAPAPVQVVIPAPAPIEPPAPTPAPVIAPTSEPTPAPQQTVSVPATYTTTASTPTVQPTPEPPQTTPKGDNMKGILSTLKSWLLAVWSMPIVSRAVHTFWQAFLAVFVAGVTPIMPMVLGHSYGDAKAAMFALIGAALAAGFSAAKTAVVLWWKAKKA